MRLDPSPSLFSRRLRSVLSLLVAIAVTGPALHSAVAATRSAQGLQVLYDFGDAQGEVVRDRAGAGEPLDLKIANPQAVRRSAGSLEVRGNTVIRSARPATRVVKAIQQTGAFTIEAWVQPADTGLTGPARIVTLSRDTGQRDFTLGQDRAAFDVRFRTTRTDANGNPSLASPSGSLDRVLTHVVYARDRAGHARLFLNGKEVAERAVDGDLSNWNPNHELALGNELTGDRPWRGTFHLVAIYNRHLSAQEVRDHHEAGVGAAAPEATVVDRPTASPTLNPALMRSGLQALYEFSAAQGNRVRDRSEVGAPLDLIIADPAAVRWSESSLTVRGSTIIASEQPAAKIIDAVRRTGEITLEAWIRPADTQQGGPARILTLSKNPNERNATLGQDKDRYEVRLRTTRTSGNGIPALSTPANHVAAALTHVVYTRERSGRARIFLNGRPQAEFRAEGDLSNWDPSTRLALGNELTGDRPWQGAFHRVAIYSRALPPPEVADHFKAGARGSSGSGEADGGEAVNARLFETKVASILSRHCLECHDPVNHKGGLDLSQKKAAMSGGKSGDALVPGKSAESLIWDAVASDEMPDERTPLSAEEKAALKEWIDGGAVWTVETIDPALYEKDGRVAQNWLRRLTVDEYIETVRAAVDVDIGKEAREILPPDLRADGFANTAYNLNVDLKHIESYARLAELIVDRMDVDAFARQFTNGKTFKDDDVRKLIEEMGRWLLRGPLREHEINAYSGITTAVGSAGGGFPEKIRSVVEAMLQSPRFLYRLENQQGDGTLWPVGPYELASRMSYILWGAPPDKALMQAAAEGELSDSTKVEAQVRRMLKDPRAIQQSVRFIDQWLNLGRLEHLQPNPDRYPDWNPALAADMREETLAFFKDLAWEQNRPLSDLLNAQFTRVSQRLARYYGLDPQAGHEGRHDLTSIPSRGGILTHASLLTVGGDEASMVTRGLFVMKNFLRGTVKDPPPCVDTTPVPTKTGLTQRGIAEQRIANRTCGGCHAKFEPLAFGLEKFDGLGAFHEADEHGNPLRDDGEILFPGTAQPVPYKSSAELMNLLAASERVRECLTWKLAQFAVGRPLVAADRPVLDKIHAQAQKEGGTYPSLITAIVLSDLVQLTRTEALP